MATSGLIQAMVDNSGGGDTTATASPSPVAPVQPGAAAVPSTAPATAAAPPAAAAPPNSFGAKVYHGILNALGGSQDISFERDQTGKMVAHTTPSTPGMQWKRIISGALTGFMGGEDAGTQGPGGTMRGLAGGIRAGTQARATEEKNLRGQADEDYKAKLETATGNLRNSLLQQEIAKTSFELETQKDTAEDHDIQSFNNWQQAIQDGGPNSKIIGTYDTPQEAMKWGAEHPEEMAHFANGRLLTHPNFVNGKRRGIIAAIVTPDFANTPSTRDFHIPVNETRIGEDGKPETFVSSIDIPAGEKMGKITTLIGTLQKEFDSEELQKLKIDAMGNRSTPEQQYITEYQNTHKGASIAEALKHYAADTQKPQQQPVTNVFVPNQQGGYTVQSVRPGQNVAPGAVTAAGMSSLNVPTAATRSMIEVAPRVVDFVDRATQLIDANEKELGPLSGRWSEFTAGKIGLKNQGYTQLRTNLGLLETALMRMHVGARGGQQIMEHFHDLINGATQDPDNLRAALGEIRDYAMRMQTERPSGAAPPPGATPPPPGATPYSVTTPDNKVHYFQTQENADAFKEKAGIK